MLVLKGIPASPGVAIGTAVLLPGQSLSTSKHYIRLEDVPAQLSKFQQALARTLEELDDCSQKVQATLGAEYASLMDTHKLILQDPSLKDAVIHKIQTDYLTAWSAISLTLQELAANFDKIEDPFFKERRNDLFDAGKRLLNNLEGSKSDFLASIKKPSLLVAHDLFPSDTINLPENQILGFCTDVGGKTSHTALLAQSLNIPAVVGLSTASRDVANGDMLIIDGENGLLVINPDRYTLANYRQIKREIKKTDSLLKTINHLPVVTNDGHRIHLYVNYDPRTDNKYNKTLITDGLGLLRTEFLFMNTPHPPSEDAQYKIYLAVAKRFDMRPTTIRLADLGADKMPDFPLDELDEDDNPFMGCRGIRLLLKNPEILHTQLRAIIRTACDVPAQIQILIPMVSSVEEVRHVRNAFNNVLEELANEGKKPVNKIALGAMIEVPSAAIALDGMIGELDFISIGTNDLIQYLVAVDRVNPEVAHMYDPCHPAVGRTIRNIIQTAHKRGKHVSICGEIASDSKMLPLLLGWQVDGLSVTPRMYLRVKNNIRHLNFEHCSDLAQAALLMGSSAEIRNLVEQDHYEDS
ncbi:MAG: phosphoenolpyruvate--protein phosphotransferase [Elusimicrobiaceae bacterium]|nr:phosphoenolpyruvate--protein phosphotransferase [Elusimicrobiaceae bacterium]MBP5617498.1 phosphoenolpyruvate--protein phosphotransferase [Elusimicrobiaceae bacterium]